MEHIEVNSKSTHSIPSLGRRFEKRTPTEKHGCLHQLFEAHVDLHPDSPAIISAGKAISYQSLEFKANRLARYLRACRIGPGKLVGLYFERSELPIVAILGCLKAGAAYVPIDPVYPSERIRHILVESELAIVLTEESLEARAEEFFDGKGIVIDRPVRDIDTQPVGRLSQEDTGVKASDLCYVIYTSGTTGRPKGVMTEHRNVYQFALAFNEICQTKKEDRIYQGFSLGFDGSVEEIWMAFSNGAALVVPNRDSPRFGNELAQFLALNRVTYFSTVPTLLSTMTDDIPTLRYLVVSGEACPPELVSRWAQPSRRMLNVYGPTEATVNTTSFECVAGRPITIGRPLRGYETYILDPQMRPVTPGERGELYVAGEGLARGYLKQPGLTEERFVTSPYIFGDIGDDEPVRLYRTGDLVRFNQEGELEFFGRIDGQVKIRGFRVELAEIEAILLEHDLIRSSSVKLFERDGLQELAAFVVLHDPSATLDRLEILTKLKSRVPDYMVPGYLDVLTELPMLTSGKADRSRLPEPVSPLVKTSGTITEPADELEVAIAETWAKTFGLPKVSVEDDFFLDLGGHSLLAAQMVTQLRAKTNRSVAVRDAYRFPSIRKLAKHLASLEATSSQTDAPKVKSSREVFAETRPLVRHTVTCMQAISLYLFGLLAATPGCWVLLRGYQAWFGQYSWWSVVGLAAAIAVVMWPLMLAVSLSAKWIFIGRYKAGKYPLWSFYYFRFWLVGRLQALSGAFMLSGTPMMSLYFRLMGAKIGRGCTLVSGHCAVFDLFSIGDESSIGADTQFPGYRVENGMLVIGGVEIGERCFVGNHSALGLNVKMEDDSRLDDQSMLPDGAVMKRGESRRGSPAQIAEVRVPELRGESIKRHPIRYSLYHIALMFVAGLPALIPALGLFAAWVYAFWAGGIVPGVLALIAVVPVGLVVYCYFVAMMKFFILRRAEPGVYPLESKMYLRKWLSDGMMGISRGLLLPLYTTIYFPPWLRLLGAKIGAHAELSTVWYFSPELTEVGEGSFFADGSIVGGKRIFRGQFEIGKNRIGARSFVGNGAILPTGGGLGDRCLLGVLSTLPGGSGSQAQDGSEWLGSPSFSLPNRQKVGKFDETVTYRPTRKLYLQRAVIDALRILIPGYVGLCSFVAGLLSLWVTYIQLGPLVAFAVAPLIGIALGSVCSLFVVALKWTVMGRFRPVVKPLWSMYVWLNEMLNGSYESIMSPFMVGLLGTPFVVPVLRMLGCKIGKHTYIESTLFSEFDLVEIGDYAALNSGAVIQNHLFEDRVMKSSSLKIGEGCSVGNMSAVLYDSEMKKGATLAPLSLVMKGETLTEGRWHGIPTVRIDG